MNEETQAPVKPRTVPIAPVAPTHPARPDPFRPTQPAVVPKPKARDDFEKRVSVALGEAEAAPVETAPAKPRTVPIAPVAPTRPARPDPFRPTQPAVVPKPKARASNPKTAIAGIAEIMDEAYEDEAHPSVKSFWKDMPADHTFAKHGTLAKHGEELTKSAFEHVKGKLKGGEDPFSIFNKIMQLERAHKNKIEEAAKRAASNLFGIPLDFLDAELGDSESSDSDEEEEGEDVEITPEIRKLINKRISINAMTHGSAVHAMMSIHHTVEDDIKKIDPRLMNLYTEIAASSTHKYWMFDVIGIAQQELGRIAGSSKVKWEKTEKGDEPTVIARAICFPVLVQELIKGVMELISHHSLEGMDKETTKTVLKHADAFDHEPLLIQVGPEMWRRFLKVVPKNVKLADVVMTLNRMEPDDVEETIEAVISHPSKAQQILSQAVAQLE